MSVKVTGQFVPAGDFAIVDGKDVSGNITGSNVSASGTGSFGRVSTATFNSTGNIDIGGNLTVTGNYTVNGTTTFISSSQLDIGDNIIHLNSVSPVRYAGIHVRDIISTTNTGSMVWDSTNDYWLAGQSGSEYRVPLQDSTSNLTDNRIIIAQANGRLEAGNLTDTGASISTSLPITASSNLAVAGNISGSSTATASLAKVFVQDSGELYYEGLEFVINQTENASTIFRNRGTQVLRLDGGAKVGIGPDIVTPSQMLHIKTTGTTDAAITLEGPNSTWTIGNDYSDLGFFKLSNNTAVGTSTAFAIGANSLAYFYGDITGSATTNLTLGGNITGSGNLEIAGKISGSATSTGSLIGIEHV